MTHAGKRKKEGEGVGAGCSPKVQSIVLLAIFKENSKSKKFGLFQRTYFMDGTLAKIAPQAFLKFEVVGNGATWERFEPSTKFKETKT